MDAIADYQPKCETLFLTFSHISDFNADESAFKRRNYSRNFQEHLI
jgi:hypothetical protein